jgi:hypothetical protein
VFRDLYMELGGIVPKIPVKYCKTLVNRARADVYRKSLWSFQLFEASWFSPALITGGTVTTTQGSASITFNATAAALITAAGGCVGRQFRIGVNTIYTIWAWTSPTATLDRLYCETGAVGSPYSIFQCYYPAPMRDLKSFISVRDPINSIDLITTRNREWVDEHDPQRQNYRQPTHVVPYMLDQNSASPTFGWMLFELWGQPQYQLPYIIYGVRKGTDLILDTDTLPTAIGEDCVMALAKKYAYEWAEANKGESPRMQGPDFRFLIGDADVQFKELYREYRKDDREIVDNWVAARRSHLAGWMTAYYNAYAGVASPGGYD